MAKALLNGVNPYLPSVELLHRFVGNFPYYPNPAPYPPIVILLSIPLALIHVNQIVSAWFIFELVILLILTCELIIYWKRKMDWKWLAPIFLLLIGWFPVTIDLFWGQLSIVLVTMLLGALLLLNKRRSAVAGLIIGLSTAIKLITWPLIIYWLVKKEWRAAIISILTTIALNLLSLAVIGIGPFMDYYLKVSRQVVDYWHSYIYNFSLFSIGYRLFEGVGSPIMINAYKVPPLVNLPNVAPILSIILVLAFLLAGMIWAVRSSDHDTAFGILICIMIAISPLSWDHYYILAIIPMIVLWNNLAKLSFPTWQSASMIIIALLLYLFNEQIEYFTLLLNGGVDKLVAGGNQLSFASSLLFWLPVLEVICLAFILWKSRVQQKVLS